MYLLLVMEVDACVMWKDVIERLKVVDNVLLMVEANVVKYQDVHEVFKAEACVRRYVVFSGHCCGCVWLKKIIYPK